MDHNVLSGPNTDWWVLTTANANGTNGLTYLTKHGGAQDNKFLVTHDYRRFRTSLNFSMRADYSSERNYRNVIDTDIYSKISIVGD
jgi:hypothetical protein